MITYIDTDEVENIKNQLNNLNEELKTKFDQLFTRFNNVPKGSQEWIGASAEKYFNIIAQDKNQYLQICKSLDGICTELKNLTQDTKDSLYENNKEYNE